jgi:hypothetical protein
MISGLKPALYGSALIGGAFGSLLSTADVARADVAISTRPTINMSCVSGVCTPTLRYAVLNVGDLQHMLASSNVTLAAESQPVNIQINAPLSWVSTHTLTLDSNRSVHVRRPIAITGGGGLSIVTNDGGTGGLFLFAPGANVAMWNLSSSLTINGAAYTLAADIATLAAAMGNGGGYYALAGNYDARPDGVYPASPLGNLSGTFQGLGNTISNLSISDTTRTRSEVGLFAINSATGTISNINLSNASIAVPDSTSAIGGIVGLNETGGIVSGDHVAGSITTGATRGTGGLVGANQGIVIASSSSVAVTGGTRSSVGGLVGYNSGAISKSFATGAGNAGAGSLMGGLAGYNDGGTISNSYATGSASGGASADSGGLVGNLQGGTVDETYSTGHPVGGAGSKVGGFLGDSTSPVVSGSYWDVTTSKTNDAGGNSRKIEGVTGLTTAQLQAALPAGLDSAVWAQNPSINGGLPYLLDNLPQ